MKRKKFVTSKIPASLKEFLKRATIAIGENFLASRKDASRLSDDWKGGAV